MWNSKKNKYSDQETSKVSKNNILNANREKQETEEQQGKKMTSYNYSVKI